MSFGLSPYEVTERRQVYWEILTYDRLQALCFGRPCAFQNRASDTQYPTDIDWIPDEDGCEFFCRNLADHSPSCKVQAHEHDGACH